jgi:hypothetical protein
MKILFVSVYYGIGDYLSTNGLINFLSIYYDQIFILCHWNDVEFLNLMYRNNDRIGPMSIDYFYHLKIENQKFCNFSVNENTFDFLSVVDLQHWDCKSYVSASDFLSKELPGQCFFNFDEPGSLPIGKKFGFDGIDLDDNLDNASFMFYNSIGLPHEIKYKNFSFNRLYEDENKLFNSLNIESHYTVICEYSGPNIEDLIPSVTVDNLIDRKYLSDKNRIINLHKLSPKYFDIVKVIENANEVHLIENSIALFVYYLQISGRMKPIPIKLHAYARKEEKRNYKIKPKFLNMLLTPKLDNWEFIY